MLENDKETFRYTYSAKEQQEVARIKQKYMPKEENKLEQLRRLDQSAEKAGTRVSIMMGVMGTMLLGIGMCCTMVWAEQVFIPGVFVGVLGMALIALAYPVYQRITRKQREKIAPQIIALSEELEK